MAMTGRRQFGNDRTPSCRGFVFANQNLIQIYIIPEVALAGAADPPTKADGMKAAAEPAIASKITRRYIVSQLDHRKFYSLITVLHSFT